MVSSGTICLIFLQGFFMFRYLLVGLVLFAPALAQADEELQKCLIEELATAADETTVAELKERCEQQLQEQLVAEQAKQKQQSEETLVITPEDIVNQEVKKDSTLVKDRLRQEYRARNNRFAILPHKPNYILPLTFNNSPNNEGFDLAGDERDIDNVEIKFQVSFKTPFWEAPFGKNSALFFAYTGQSYWQAYNSEVSSPFRETNHQPEIFAAWSTDWKLGGWQIPAFSLGVEHQSNGRSGLSSRSWNRLYTEWAFEKDRWVLAFRPWWRIPEDEKEDPLDPEGDDNPDIDDYMGYFELQTRYQWDEHNFGIMLRNNLRSDNKGAVQFDWTFPLDEKGKLRGYVQYFNGYGESLIDYNRRTNRLGVGFVLTDWL
ncbi:MAG: phospholipase A [Gammaproteobacteria bacterium]|nr:phospholipase A [Gammaproteobacteria bacterium]